ncbi:MAG: serine hydrolase domain-containing protein [Planctomycetota bacterium]
MHKVRLAASPFWYFHFILLLLLATAFAEARQFTSELNQIRSRHDLPALGCAVLFQGRLVAVETTGYRKYGSEVRVTPNDNFHLGSCTKAMTATMLAVLIEQGKIDPNMTVARALPELTDSIQPDYRVLTLEHLLSHHTGLPEKSWPPGKTFHDMHSLEGDPRQQRRSYVELILQQEPLAAPGTRFIYANANYSVASAIAERVTDTPWEELMGEYLFNPLRMTTAGFGAMGSRGTVEQPWQHAVRSGERVPIPPAPRADNPPVIGPGGTVHCSLADWAKFIQAHLDGIRGRNNLLSQKMFEMLHTPRYGSDYAWGWRVVSRKWGGGKVLTHAGSNNQNYAVAWVAPLKNFAVLVATNQGGDAAAKACDEVASAVIQKTNGLNSPGN